MEDKEKGIKLELEIEEKGKITFLDVKLKRNKEDGKIQTGQYQKKENAGIYCNIRSDVDEGTKRNLVKNLKNKVGRLTTQENKEKLLKEQLWTQLNKNGYVRNKGIERGKAKKKKKVIKKEEGKARKWKRIDMV